MPLNFRPWRTKKYNVSTKNSYVVCVHLLDNQLLECTLTAESTGHECLENIAQRIELAELEYFGFRYVINKKLQYRWVDLEKPLKKQLDKHAHSPLLYFGVMFYVANPHQLSDGTARYQYYLQLKSDVIDEKLRTTPEQAVLLAAYSLQVELGEHDGERHVPEQMRELVLLPRSMITEERTLLNLTAEVTNTHRSLQGMPAQTAELQYVNQARHLENYGIEYYSAKDESETDLLFGASFFGIYIKYLNGQPTMYFKWSDVTKLMHNKRSLCIETSLSPRMVLFNLDEVDMAKYVYRICSLQQMFYNETKDSINSVSGLDLGDTGATGPLSDLQQSVPTESSTRLPVDDVPNVLAQSDPPATELYHVVTGSDESAVMEMPPAEPSTAVQLQFPAAQQPPQPPQPNVQQFQSEPVYNIVSSEPQPEIVQDLPSTLSLSNNFVNSAGVLPAYRPTPDYSTVMQQKMENMTQQQVQGIGSSQVYLQPETLAYSQPEISHTSAPPSYNQYLSQASRHVNNPALFGMTVLDGQNTGNYSNYNHVVTRPVDRTSSLIIHPTYSTPNLAPSPFQNYFSVSENRINETASSLVHPHYGNRPPPAYNRPSNSTPDLASQTTHSQLKDYPDLVSHRVLNDNNPLLVQSRFDQSVENLSVDARNLQISQNVAKSAQNLDDASSIRSDAYSRDISPTEQGVPVVEEKKNQDLSPSHLNTYTNPAVYKLHASQTKSHTSPINQEHFVRTQSGEYNHNIVSSNSRQQQTYQPGHTSKLSPAHRGTAQTGAVHQSSLSEPDSCSDTIDCLDTTRLSNDQTSSLGHSKTSSLDTNSLSLVDPGNLQLDDQMKMEQLKHAEVEESPGQLDPEGVSPSVTSSPSIKSHEDENNGDITMGPLKLAAMHGLSASRGSILEELTTSISPSRAPKDERRRNLECRLEEGQVFIEFEHIPKKRSKCECTAASDPSNLERNRFKDVLPYDDNRVKLTPNKENTMGYINASHVKMKIIKEDWWYLAAQGPLAHTVADFWQMVWEQDVEVIAMLTGLLEDGRSKCHRYWPEKKGSKNRLKLKNYEVSLKFCNSSQCYVTSGLVLRQISSKKERTVWHLQYTDWPDHGCPDDLHGFLAYLDEIESVRRHTFMERNDGRHTPVVVHCSAGVGRTGVVILAEVMKANLEHNQKVDVPEVLHKMREQRMYLVQTMTQYSFVYKTLVEYLNSSRLI